MARRMTFVGAEVKACVELMPYSAGLKRNIVQCLDDFDIPLLLRHTVTDIHGRERLEGVTIAEVDDARRPIAGSERYIACDTLLLSVGLIPENELSVMAGVTLSPATGGAVVDERLQTVVPGIFSCGNVLHVHDLVDHVSKEAALAGKNAARFALGALPPSGRVLPVRAGLGVSAIVPQVVSAEPEGDVSLMFRPSGVYRDASVLVRSGAQTLQQKKARIFTPGEMVTLKLAKEAFMALPDAAEICVTMEGKDA